METKPPTKTFPKLVMKEWPEKESLTFYRAYADPEFKLMATLSRKALSDFTRVLEGVEGQKRPQKEKSRDE